MPLPLSELDRDFVPEKDVDAVIETQRGHNLGRVIYEGEAAPNTGIPGMIGGYAKNVLFMHRLQESYTF